jgi:hypothetical protein
MAIGIMLHKINPNLLQYLAIFRLILDEINFDNLEDDYFDIDIDFDFDVDIDIVFIILICIMLLLKAISILISI